MLIRKTLIRNEKLNFKQFFLNSLKRLKIQKFKKMQKFKDLCKWAGAFPTLSGVI